jgi:hypothetical protein
MNIAPEGVVRATAPDLALRVCQADNQMFASPLLCPSLYGLPSARCLLPKSGFEGREGRLGAVALTMLVHCTNKALAG